MSRLRRRLQNALLRVRAWFDRPRWLKRPGRLAGRRVCLLVSWSRDGALSEHTLHLARAWHAEGFAVVLITACDRRTAARWNRAWDGFIEGAAVRSNIGYDFGSWAAGIRALPDVRRAALLALANDSVYGPLHSFHAMLARVDASAADLVGLTDSHQHVHHLQSYLVFYRGGALRNAAFGRFWRRRFIGGREDIIASAELPLLSRMASAGLAVEVLFPTEPSPTVNPTLLQWRELIAAGYPFVKVQLLRDNPFEAQIGDWAAVLDRNGLDPAMVVRHLGSAFPASAAGRAGLAR